MNLRNEQTQAMADDSQDGGEKSLTVFRSLKRFDDLEQSPTIDVQMISRVVSVLESDY